MSSEPTRRWVLQSIGVTVWERRAPQGLAPPPIPTRPKPVQPLHAEPQARIQQIDRPRIEPPLADRELGDIATMDWTALETAVGACTRCPLHQSRTQGVFGVGARDASWMIIGEAPGAEEDRRGVDSHR
jgi:DNA polymerase